MNTIENKIKNKLTALLKILDFKRWTLNDEEASILCFPDDFNTEYLSHFKFAPITSVGGKRSFPNYKYLLSENRRSFIFNKIKHSLKVQCNNLD